MPLCRTAYPESIPALGLELSVCNQSDPGRACAPYRLVPIRQSFYTGADILLRIRIHGIITHWGKSCRGLGCPPRLTILETRYCRPVEPSELMNYIRCGLERDRPKWPSYLSWNKCERASQPRYATISTAYSSSLRDFPFRTKIYTLEVLQPTHMHRRKEISYIYNTSCSTCVAGAQVGIFNTRSVI